MQEKRSPSAGLGVLITGTILLALGLVAAAGALWPLRSSYVSVTARASMEPTYREGTRVAVERIDGDSVRRGDVVLFAIPDRYSGLPVLQRVVGLGGDRVVYADGVLTVNDRPVTEPYVKPADFGPPSPDVEVTVPPGRMFLLGDNRGNSNDSRYFLTEDSGTVPVTAVQGRALADGTAPAVLGLTVLLGVLLVVGGGICVVVGLRTRMRVAATGPGRYV
ncbi:signal peptidase I [Streptomyces sp. NPDC006516]|uniref:signal peptidase I n=1 Tax=Streptomyces sp. NPDC006516 TaxID=3154309 RepID=UPI0033A172E1